jgi:DNA-binding MarR family transcriptional regulator
MVAIVDELESQGLVERRRSTGDRRTVPLHVTEKGTRVAEQARAATDASNKRIFAGFSPADQNVFYDLLVRMADAVVPQVDEPASGNDASPR